ncbi:uncharacterized protein LOC114530012 [Dendronephthya gigantea]|uniref:uncharacterized protein LOC114530012 n=1 Tax=Dendronephthya gigantea TaxID=151771 RepID=UPI00106C8017|nr:uncharacterized protein LOC114530012 [Dendronephthya gigantea]XP_028407384.1 uncharacterized protein LOC114530012 [Dendronephthya gigantea]XP_028407385.1 uncharacterized protein LOC114530012 [Dendronephthya gigantea]
MSAESAKSDVVKKRKLDYPDDQIISEVALKKLYDGTVYKSLDDKLLEEYGKEWIQNGNDEIHMIPCVFTKGSSDDRGTKAEGEIYQTLRSLNTDKNKKINDYFSNVKIPGFVFHGQKYNGHEIDFLFITIHGLLVIECKAVGKGNRATSKYNEACGQLSKRIPTLKNVLERFGIDVSIIPIVGIVAFPLLSRCDVEREDGSPEVLFSEDLAVLKNWLRRKIFVTVNPITFEIYLKIVKTFLGLYHCGEKLRNFYEYKKRGILDTERGLESTCEWYTREQRAFLKNDRFHNVWISGAAGTGKTFVLKHRLEFLVSEIRKEMSESGEDMVKKSVKPILVITYNRPIKLDIEDWVKKEIKAKGSSNDLVRLQTFSALMNHILYDEGDEIKTTKDAEKVTYIMGDESILKKYFSSNYTKVFRKYQHILVDEAQDLPDNWLDLLCKMLHCKRSSIWVFKDPYQVVRRNITTVTNVPVKFTRHWLSKVIRNPRNVFEAYKKCYESLCEAGSEELVPPSINHHVYGLEPRYIVAKDDNSMLSELVSTIQDLLKKRVNCCDIAILTCGNVETRDNIEACLQNNKIKHQDADKHTSQNRLTVTVDSYQRFKGLEEKIIIFCVPSGWAPRLRDQDVYVTLSRALCQVIVIAPKKIVEYLNPID